MSSACTGVFQRRHHVLCPSSVFSAERQQVLGALERLQAKLAQRAEWTHSDTVGSLRQTLQSPLFTHILTLQQSIRQLRNQVMLTTICLPAYINHVSMANYTLGRFRGQSKEIPQHMLALMLVLMLALMLAASQLKFTEQFLFEGFKHQPGADGTIQSCCSVCSCCDLSSCCFLLLLWILYQSSDLTHVGSLAGIRIAPTP